MKFAGVDRSLLSKLDAAELAAIDAEIAVVTKRIQETWERMRFGIDADDVLETPNTAPEAAVK